MVTTVHQPKMTLRSVRPPVWRRIQVGSGMTLGELARVLETAMGWMASFDIEGANFTLRSPRLLEGW